MIPVTAFAGKTVAVFGLGRSGLSAGRALRAGGSAVLAWDDDPVKREAGRALIGGLPEPVFAASVR